MTTFATSDASLAATTWMGGTVTVDDDRESVRIFADGLQLQGFDIRTGEHHQTAHDKCR
jgi:hypothetical protein